MGERRIQNLWIWRYFTSLFQYATSYVGDSGDLTKSPCDIMSLLMVVSSFLPHEIQALSEVRPWFCKQGMLF